jgi:hypothetical protein
MSSNFNPKIVDSTLQILERRCLILLCEGYKILLSQKKIAIDWKEDDISKELILCLEPNENRQKWRISIVPEYPIYTDKIPSKESPRIDFCFSDWTDVEWKYYSEAKILIESDSYKKGRKKRISARSLHERYIETGIDHYLSGWYPPGCLSGYILQGKSENIINCINQFLKGCDREKEVLTKQPFELPDFDSLYFSSHKNGFSIKHLMFNFILSD